VQPVTTLEPVLLYVRHVALELITLILRRVAVSIVLWVDLLLSRHKRAVHNALVVHTRDSVRVLVVSLVLLVPVVLLVLLFVVLVKLELSLLLALEPVPHVLLELIVLKMQLHVSTVTLVI